MGEPLETVAQVSWTLRLETLHFHIAPPLTKSMKLDAFHIATPSRNHGKLYSFTWQPLHEIDEDPMPVIWQHRAEITEKL